MIVLLTSINKLPDPINKLLFVSNLALSHGKGKLGYRRRTDIRDTEGEELVGPGLLRQKKIEERKIKTK